MPRKKNPEGVHGTRNLNGMGNLYFNKKTERLEYKIMVNGRIRMATGKAAKTVNERKKLLVNTPRTKLKAKFHDWVEKIWLPVYIKPFKKASTHKQYEDTWKCYIKPNIKNVPLNTVDVSDIRKLIAKMNECGLSAYTMKQVKKVLNLIFERALKDKCITENPVNDDVKIPTVQQKARKVLKPEELQKMFDYLLNSRWYWPVRFMLYTGLRRGELLALKWTDIDEENKMITVSDNLTNEGIGTTKSNKVHYVALPDIASKCLNEYKKVLSKEGNPSLFKNGLIFTTKFGDPLRPQSFNNIFRRIQKIGVDASPHSMRHTFVYYSKNKLTLPELKDNLGHDETTSTLDIYGLLISNTKNIADKLDQAFKDIVSETSKLKSQNKVVNFGDYKKHAK